MRVARYTRQGADPCRVAMLRQQVEYSVKPRRTMLHCNRLARQAQFGGVKARNAVPIRAFWEALMSGYRRLKIEGGAVFFTLAPADRGSDLLGRFGE